MSKDSAANVLATMIAPAMAGMVSAEIEKAVAKIHANMAPVRHMVVIRERLETNLGEMVHEAAPKVLQLVNQGLNVMLVGPAGCGKTMLADTVATALGRQLTVISCSAGMSEAQLLGRLLPLGAGGAFTYIESPFMRAYATGGVILLDEMDAADANLLLVINAALANGGITVEARAALGPDADTYVKRHPETVIISATNTWGAGADTQYVGRGALDVSTLDRFYRVSVDYDAKLEGKLGSPVVVAWVTKVRAAARQNKLRRVVSTRTITRLEKALAAGYTFAEAKRDELASWTADERAKVGE
jgi:MoxR-like ATPase